jgi:hypothetical protein
LLHWQKFTGYNRGDQKVNFSLQNALNLIFASAILQFFPGIILPDPVKRGKRREEGLGGEGQGNRGERKKEGHGLEGKGRIEKRHA